MFLDESSQVYKVTGCFLQSLALVLFELAANWSNILTNREGNTMKTADVLIH